MLRKQTLLFTLISLIIFTSCEKDFSLNGDYKRTPIIFGLLDQADSVHMIRITRTFLGDGNNNDFAKIADSNYYKQVDAKVIEMDGNEVLRTWQLHDTLITNKETGLFYGPEQKFYTFYANDLNENYEYKFDGIFDEGKYVANATTKLVSGNYTGPWQQLYTSFSFANSSSSVSNSYPALRPVMSAGSNISVKKAKLEIKYMVTYKDESTAIKIITWAKSKEEDINIQYAFAGEEFYKYIKDNIDTDANVVKRSMIDVTVITTLVDDNTKKYMAASAPASTISQSKPQFTNVNGSDTDGALGLFAARHVLSKTLPLNGSSIKELCIGQYTGNLSFCSTLAEHNGKVWSCSN